MIKTVFGDKVLGTVPLSEHPRPQFKREAFVCLNGEWDFEKNQKKGYVDSYSRKILVPFAVETSLGGIEEPVTKDDVLHYRKRFKKVLEKGQRALLHFDAVDQVCDVYFNKKLIGHHEGGYLPFAFDITEWYEEENEIYVEVQDDTDSEIYPHGKQCNNAGGIWYTPTSGIYQTVWLEIVPEDHLSSLKLTPVLKERRLHIEFGLVGLPYPIAITASRNGEVIASLTINEGREADLLLPESVECWTPENPVLYDLDIQAKGDHVTSYFGMREFGAIEYKGHKVFALNGKPYFLSGILDQGYVPESGLTFPSEEAMLFDLELLKEYGFNMVRKHIKLEPMRWYALCDRLGLIVFQDFVNGGKYNPILFTTGTFFQYKWKDDTEKFISSVGRGNPESRAFFEKDFTAFVEHLYNVPSLAAWVIFNEAWGQFESVKFEKILREADPTRLVDAVSGWCDQGGGDFDSHHIYFRKTRLKPSKDRILFLSEFGGYSLHLPRHSWNEKVFGYKHFKNREALNEALKKLYEKEIIPLRDKAGLAALVYTQLSDVEAETNGLVTYDRKVKKADSTLFKALNESLKFHD